MCGGSWALVVCVRVPGSPHPALAHAPCCFPPCPVQTEHKWRLEGSEARACKVLQQQLRGARA